MHPTDPDIITAPIDRFCGLAGIGRSKTYELIAAGEIESVVIGGRRLILIESWRRLVAGRLVSARADRAAAVTAAATKRPSRR